MVANETRQPDPLVALLGPESVVGVARLEVLPAFDEPIACTLAYRADSVRVEVVDGQAAGRGPVRGGGTYPISSLRGFGPLQDWDKLRAVASVAPACSTLTEDGVSYRHAALHRTWGAEAVWSNPGGDHVQWQLIDAYRALMDWAGLVLRAGSEVRAVTRGPLTGVQARVEAVDRARGLVRASIDVGGRSVALDLPGADFELSPGSSKQAFHWTVRQRRSWSRPHGAQRRVNRSFAVGGPQRGMSEVCLGGRRAAAAQPDQSATRIPLPGLRGQAAVPGTYVVYLVVLLISLSVVVGIGYAMVEFGGADRPFRMLWLAGVGLVVAGYAAVQLARPIPLTRPAADEAERSGDPDADR